MPYEQYFYTNVPGSLTGPNDTITSLISPCIDLTSQDSILFNFQHHIYVAQAQQSQSIKRLEVWADTSASGGNWYLKKIILIDPNFQKNDPFVDDFISLFEESGKIVKLKFSAVRHPHANRYISTLAIRSFKFFRDVKPILEIAKTDGFGTCINDTIFPEFTFKAYSANVPNLLPIKIYLNNTLYARDTIPNNVTIGDSAILTTIKPIAITNSAINVSIVLDVDQNPNYTYQDSITYHLDGPVLKISNTGYFTGFENETTETFDLQNKDPFKAGDWNAISLNEATTYIRPHLVNQNNANYVGYLPTGANGSQNYWLQVFNNLNTTNDISKLYSRCLELENFNNPLFVYRFAVNKVPISTLPTYHYTVGLRGVNTAHAGTTILKGAGYSGNWSGGWQYDFVPLDSHKDSIFQLSFSMRGNFTAGGFGLDNFEIIDRANIDLAIGEPIGPKALFESTPNYNIQFILNNLGLNSVSNATLRLIWFEACDTTNPVDSQSYSVSTIWPLGKHTQATSIAANQLPRGGLYFKAKLVVPGDARLENNTTSWYVVRSESNYLNNQKSIDQCFMPELLIPRGAEVWHKTNFNPQLGFGALPGQNYVWTTNRTGVQSPGFYSIFLNDLLGTDTVRGLELEILHSYDFSNDDSSGGFIRYLDINENIWKTVNPTNQQNGYNGVINTFEYGGVPGNTSHAFTGSSNGFITTKIKLPNTIFNRSLIRFDVSALHSENNVGWAIADVKVNIPVQDAAALDTIFTLSPPYNTVNQQLEVYVRNQGEISLSEVTLTVQINGNQVSQSLHQFSPIILKNGIGKVKINIGSLNSGNQNICVFSSLPNGNVDPDPSDDTACTSIEILAEKAVPYCSDFDQSLDFGPQVISTEKSPLWLSGQPVGFPINTAHSGQTVWMTGQNGYDKLEGAYLYTPSFNVLQSGCYNLSFKHQFQTEAQVDGGNVEFTTDSGATWQILGNYSMDTLWFNTPFLGAFNQTLPGWSGNSFGYISAKQRLEVMQPTVVGFRFVFRSDASIHGRGWAIDDVCLEFVGPDCKIGLDENQLSSDLSVFPNPASTVINIKSKSNRNQIELINIFTTSGNLVFSKKFDISNNSTDFQLDVEHFNNGMYLLQIQTKQGVRNFKFLKVTE